MCCPEKKGHIACRVTFERARLEMVTRREGERGLDETCQTPAGCKRCAVSSRKRCADALLDGARKGVCVCRGVGGPRLKSNDRTQRAALPGDVQVSVHSDLQSLSCCRALSDAIKRKQEVPKSTHRCEAAWAGASSACEAPLASTRPLDGLVTSRQTSHLRLVSLSCQ